MAAAWLCCDLFSDRLPDIYHVTASVLALNNTQRQSIGRKSPFYNSARFAKITIKGKWSWSWSNLCCQVMPVPMGFFKLYICPLFYQNTAAVFTSAFGQALITALSSPITLCFALTLETCLWPTLTRHWSVSFLIDKFPFLTTFLLNAAFPKLGC